MDKHVRKLVIHTCYRWLFDIILTVNHQNGRSITLLADIGNTNCEVWTIIEMVNLRIVYPIFLQRKNYGPQWLMMYDRMILRAQIF